MANYYFIFLTLIGIALWIWLGLCLRCMMNERRTQHNIIQELIKDIKSIKEVVKNLRNK